MTPQEPPPESTPPEPASELARILDAYLADLRAGKAPDRAALLAAHPQLAAQLESCLAALDFIHRAEHADPALPPTLGDFRILREIGRGAMGVVYEAEQVSLKRRVALKVLRFGGAADAEAMERFRREAETVARLHHTNIVPVFAVGREGGVHFFAMQLIAGRSLAAVLAEAKGKGRPPDARTVAGWGVQAAEALAHAHARGVIARAQSDKGLAEEQPKAYKDGDEVMSGASRRTFPRGALSARKRERDTVLLLTAVGLEGVLWIIPIDLYDLLSLFPHP